VTPATTNVLPAAAGRRSTPAVARALFALTKPRIIELLLVTTIPTMLLAERGLPSARILLVTLAGGALAAGSANTINCYIDRDIDAVMRRTSHRPLARPAPMAVVKPVEALIFGIVLGAASTVLLGTLVNWLSAILADAAILFYVFVYTIGLKRRTASNIVIGGAAGCFPVLVGWSAVTGSVSLPAIVLFAVIFFWTPPHFWALAMKFRDDYLRGRPGRLVPRRGTPPARPGHPGHGAGSRRRQRRGRRHGAQGGRGNLCRDRAPQRQPRPDAPVPPVHRLPDPAVRRDSGRLPPPLGPLVGPPLGPLVALPWGHW
jgi:hypothetical protein